MQRARDSLQGAPDPDQRRELQRILYGLYGIIRLHFAKEEELYLPLLDAGLGAARPVLRGAGLDGFATTELRNRHGVLATGLILGLVWGAWHVPFYAATYSGAVPLALYVPVMAFSILLPSRVLMAWVYDRTQSVLMAVIANWLVAIVLPSVQRMNGNAQPSETSVNDIDLSPACDLMIIFPTGPADPSSG